MVKLVTHPPADAAFDLWLNAAVPRYTSYPPATAFNAGVGAVDFKNSLVNLAADEAISLYLHIPFCDSLCLYCGCNTGVTHRVSRIERYLDALKREVDLITAMTGKKLRVSHLHFGGGTPNILSPEMTHDVFNHLRGHFDFSECKEIAVELDPRVITQDKIKALVECGVTRVSLGVQDFQDDVQVLVKRLQPYALVERVCDWLRAAGITKINFDLMYGLPLQTPESVIDTARMVCTLAPDRIALFSYAHLPRLKKHQKPLEAHGIPGPEMRLAMDDAARQVFTQAGYVAVGMDHFAHPQDSLVQAMQRGNLHRNFQGYTDDATQTLLALGPSSISQMREGFFQNERLTDTYQATINKGELATTRGYLLNQDDVLRAAIIEAFMCNLSCNIAEICARFDADIRQFAPEFKKLAEFEKHGLAARDGTTYRLTSAWRMPIRILCHVFDCHAAATPAGFSRVA
ncbi:MAG: oxygen-independent coproporphyrinogen III oxidase [Alphaproteobacteria bacterium]|nr:oxygen-independent coproporphyrinogen III oxidase [Alphaproteobacteria bacterium]